MKVSTCVIVSLLFGLMLSAQEANQGTITGFVYDQSQALIANAEITVTSQETGRVRVAKSGSEGLYTVVALRSGVYNVLASSSGFKSAEVRDVVLNVGASVRLNFNLELGALTETVTVEGAAVILKTETGEISSLVTGTQVTEIPINGRNFTQFLSLGTGVVSQQTGRQMGLGQEGNPLMAVHGGRISMNKYTYDGTLAMDTGGNRGLDLFPPMEAIAEVKVQKSNYGADTGGFGYGVVNIVTKSGTQQFHGDVYEYFRNDKLDARNFFANQRQSIRLNNFGYTLGGPFYIPGRYNSSRTKDFFFWSQSWARRIGPQINSFTTPPIGVFTALVPTAAQRAGNFAGGAVIRDPAGQPYPGNMIPQSQLDPNALILINTFFRPEPGGRAELCTQHPLVHPLSRGAGAMGPFVLSKLGLDCALRAGYLVPGSGHQATRRVDTAHVPEPLRQARKEHDDEADNHRFAGRRESVHLRLLV